MSALSARKIALLSGAPGPSLDLNFLSGMLDPRITFTRAAGPATYFDATGTLQTAGTNVARFDYDPVTLASRGLLIEEARTNLLLNSASLGTQTVTVAAVANPLSFYGTGTVTLTGVSSAGPLVGTGDNNRVSLTFTPTAGLLICTVTGTVTNANLEAGAFPTSYITTTGASATRATDVATLSSASLFLGSQASIAIDGIALQAPAAATNAAWAILDDGTAANVLEFLSPAGNSGIRFIATANSVSLLAAGTEMAVGALPATYKAGISLGPAAGRNAMNGVLGTAASPSAGTTALNGLNRLRLGNGGIVPVSGYFRRVRYWPRALSAIELQAATR